MNDFIQKKDRVETMYRFFGASMEPGAKCRDCPHIRTTKHGQKRFCKCVLYGSNNRADTNWRDGWHACSLYHHAELVPGVNFETALEHMRGVANN